MIIVVVIVISFLFYGFFIEPFILFVFHKFFYFENLPKSFDGFKIVQISDLHFTRLTRLHKKVLAILEREKPDMIAVTGDFVGWNLKITCGSFCKDIANKSRNVFAVLGNWDHKMDNFDFLVKNIKDNGISVLINESVPIHKDGEEIFILGTDDSFTGYANLKETFKNVPENAFVILLTHCPDIIYEATRYKPQLVLSGHTHGGQVKIPFLKAFYVPSKFGTHFLSGLFKIKETYLYVNRGLGTSHLPFRLFSPPEVTVFTLYLKRKG